MNDDPRNILIYLPNWVGDVVMATPALRALRRRFAGARFTCVGRQVSIDTLEGLGWFDASVVDPSWPRATAANFFRLARRLRQGRFDAAILMPNSFRTALAVRLARVPRRIGYARDGRGWLLSDRLEPRRDEAGAFVPLSAIDYYLDLARHLGAEVADRRMELAATAADDAAADAMLKEAGSRADKPLVMLNPGASFGVSKMWNADRYGLVADALIERFGAQIIINAAPNEKNVAADVAAAMKHAPLINFADRDNTIGALKALMRRCRVLITNDTGARHFAAAMGIGVVTLFGSTDPRWAELNYSRERILRADVPCSPCQRKLCPQPAGPRYHQCMMAIAPDSVIDAAGELLSQPMPSGASA